MWGWSAYSRFVGDRDGRSSFYISVRGGYAGPWFRRGASALRADPGTVGASVPASIPLSACSADRGGGSQPLARRGGAGEDLGCASLRGADAVHANAATHAPHAPGIRHEPAGRDADRRLLPAPTPGRAVSPCPQAADAPELPRRLRAAAHAEDPRTATPVGTHLERHPRP